MRISMSLPGELLTDFDEVLNDRGYQSRSKGIRDAIKDYIIRYKWINEMEGERTGILSVIYDHQKVGLMKNLIDIQIEFRKYIKSNIHVDMSENQCYEVILVKGDIKEIIKVKEKLMKLEGVENVKLDTKKLK